MVLGEEEEDDGELGGVGEGRMDMVSLKIPKNCFVNDLKFVITNAKRNPKRKKATALFGGVSKIGNWKIGVM